MVNATASTGITRSAPIACRLAFPLSRSAVTDLVPSYKELFGGAQDPLVPLGELYHLLDILRTDRTISILDRLEGGPGLDVPIPIGRIVEDLLGGLVEFLETVRILLSGFRVDRPGPRRIQFRDLGAEHFVHDRGVPGELGEIVFISENGQNADAILHADGIG